jgi:beta-phosphoglucomutase-like phosphatase (HAD superfamily)
VPTGPELVIFDNDGVLVDSEGLANQVLADLLTACGYPATRDEAVRRFMGGTMAGVRAAVEAETGAPLPDDFEQRYVAHGKPALDLFLHAAAETATPPERCVVVEDSPAGVTAARAAGMRVIGYAAMTPEDRLAAAGADAIVAAMDDLPAVLGSFVPGLGQTDV